MSYIEEFHRAFAGEVEKSRDLIWRVNRLNVQLGQLVDACSSDNQLGLGVTATIVDDTLDGCVVQLRSQDHLVRISCRVGSTPLKPTSRSLILWLSIARHGRCPTDGPSCVIPFDDDEDIQSALVEVMRMLGFGLARAEISK